MTATDRARSVEIPVADRRRRDPQRIWPRDDTPEAS